MLPKDNCYLIPAAPELRAKFLRTRELLQAGEPLAEEATIDVLDLQTFTFISTRRKRIHTTTGELASVVGTRKALVLLVDFSDKKATQNQQHYADMLFSSSNDGTNIFSTFARGKFSLTHRY